MRTFWPVFILLGAGACYGMLPGDTEGVQRRAEWWSDARLRIEIDPTLGLERVRVEPGDHDAVVGRFEFDPTTASFGDEYGVTFGLDLGPADSLRLRVAHSIGGADGLPTYLGARVGLGPTLVADSMIGTLYVFSRGMMQLIGRIEAELFYSSLVDADRVTVERFRQRVDFLRPPNRTPQGDSLPQPPGPGPT